MSFKRGGESPLAFFILWKITMTIVRNIGYKKMIKIAVW